MLCTLSFVTSFCVHKIFTVVTLVWYLILNKSSDLRFLLTVLVVVPNTKSKGQINNTWLKGWWCIVLKKYIILKHQLISGCLTKELMLN